MTKPTTIEIDADFPGGNIVVESIKGDTVRLHQDRRDTVGYWFYWSFRVRGAAGRTVRFNFTDGLPVGVFGPAISLDRGKNWEWLGEDPLHGSGFRYTFARDAGEVRFCTSVPYLDADLRTFLKRHDGVKVSTLCRTAKGRPVHLLRMGAANMKRSHHVVLTARHHCCEVMASHVLEGLMAEVLSSSATGRWLCENASFLIVPFVDTDGVEEGDQGKNRAPRDHNRDYVGRSIYASCRALRELLPRWSGGRLDFVLDMHCPCLRRRGGDSHRIYLVGPPVMKAWRPFERFSEIVQSTQSGPLKLDLRHNLPYGTSWNTRGNFTEGKSFAGWAAEQPGTLAAATIEIPYARASGEVVTADGARRFGRDLAKAMKIYLQQQ